MSSDDLRVNDGGQLIPAYELYSIKAVMLATVLGSVVAGGIVMAINYGRLGWPEARRQALVWSGLALAALLSVGFLIPKDVRIPNSLIHIVLSAGMYAIVQSRQGPAIDLHRERGGPLASVWRAAGIGGLCGVLIVGALFGMFYAVFPYTMGPVVELNDNDEVFYSGEASEEDARLLGELLTEIEFFGDPDGASVFLEASSGHYTVSFVLIEGAWEDPELVAELRWLGGVLADELFGRPLTIALCDEYFNSQEFLRIE